MRHQRSSHAWPIRLIASSFWLLSSLVLTLVAFSAPPVVAGEEPEAGQPAADIPGARFLRVVKESGEPRALEVAVVHCVPNNPAEAAPTVDLISAVHVAESEYYDQLNKRFADYDAVLYELVAPKGTRVEPEQGGTGSPVSAVQVGLTDLLDLEFQLDGIDYQAENLVHADMSPDELARSMQDRGESVLQMFLRTMGYAMARQQQTAGSDAQMLAAMFAPDRALAMRRVMAQQFEDMPGMIRAIDGPKGSTLIAQRNKKALEELRRQIDAGKTRLAIFYGAGHMEDLLARLKADFNLAPSKTEWLEAWDLREPE